MAFYNIQCTSYLRTFRSVTHLIFYKSRCLLSIISPLMHIIKLLVASLLLLCTRAHIYSSQSKVTYDFSGNPMIYHIFLSLETGLGGNDYLMINWPIRLHSGTDKSVVKAKLISFSNNLEIVSTYCSNYPVGSTTTLYYVTFGVSLTAQKWYEIQLFPDVIPGSLSPAVSLPFNGLIQIEAISNIVSNNIVYDSNYAFRYISVQSFLATPSTLTVAVNPVNVAYSTTVASIYTTNIDITPAITSATGANFTLTIYYDSGNGVHVASGTGLLDFTFMGLCQSVTPATGAAAVLNNCQISSDLTSITFSVNSVTAGQPIRIQTQISNPLYVSIRGLRVHYVDFISGVVKQNGYLASAFQVSAIPITDLAADRVYLFWGISTENTDPELTGLSLGLYKATGSNVGPFNSFNAGFSFTQTSPIDGRYTVKMYLGASGFLQGSVAHNLPAYSGLKVYCHFDTPTKFLVCQNVGPFINTNYRYFISGKAYYNSGSGSSVSGFGDVQILPVVYNSAGTQLVVSLYTALTSGDSIPLIDSQEYLDTSGYHNPNTYKIGVAKIVSYQDDGTLSSTANAMNNFLRGTNSTIGIVPDLGVSQQLLLLMKVNSVAGGSGSGNAFKMRMLYNNKVIGFETGYETRGLDFVGYDASNSVWSISFAPCYITNNVVCEKYNNDTPTNNIQIRNNATVNFYGLYKFNCAQAFTATPTCFNGDCATACNLFTGYGTSNYNAGVMAMRKVTFPSTQFHSSLYADSNLLDFLVVFLQGTGFVAASLINAYTMVGTTMQNIKASYVNYFDFDATNYNKGERIPSMIRIAGGVLPRESRNATVVGVFFDDNVDAQTFYTYKDKAYDVGCSTGSCLYYPNTGINLPPNDIWHTMRRVEFYNIPAIQNEFNMLVPITPTANRYTYDSDPMPDTLTIAFFTTNYSIGDATGLLQTVSVYRLFGTVVTGSITGAITNINGLIKRTSNYFGTYLTSNNPSTYSGYAVTYSINTTNINANPPNNTFTYGYTAGTVNPNGQYGMGMTLTCLYYNIFSSSTVAFESPPANTATTCTIFGYIYNEQTAGQNLDRNGQWIYTAFCPVDSSINLYGPDGNIQFKNPQYPNVFTSNYQLFILMTYGFSDQTGQLVHYKKQTGTTAYVRTCTTAKINPYNPSTSGKQRATFTVSTPQIRMAAASKYDGYPRFSITLTLPTMSNIAMQSGCIISDPLLTCTTTGGSSSMSITVTYIGTGVMTVTYFEMQLYAITSGDLGAGGDYTLTIYLPQYIAASSTYANFGQNFNSISTFCTCTSNFKIGTAAPQTRLNFDAPVTTSTQFAARSYYTFNFGSYSYREAFFDTSYFQFGFGFLTEPSNTDRNTNNNFRCMIYQNTNGALTLSSKWSYFDFSNFASVKLYPKATIDDPQSYLFTMGCYGSGVPTGTNTTAMSLAWIDAGSNVQTATSISYSAAGYTAAASSALTVALTNKRFNTQGMKAFYSFSLTSTSPLTESTRIYFNFHFRLSSLLDNEGYVECYLRTASAIVDSAAIFTYCTFTQNRQLVIWNNLAVAASTTIYIDIYNIQIPKSTDTSPNIITVSLDTDSDYSNGVTSRTTLTDTAAGSNAITDIIITSTSVSSNYIRTPQTIVVKFNTVTNILTSGLNLYLLLPGPYGQWINRGQALTMANCALEADNAVGTNRLSACTFISKRILKMTLSANTGYNLHTLTLIGIYSPSKVPSGRYNQYRFKLFTSSAATQLDINRYSFTDLSSHLTLQPDSTLIDLSWKYYALTVSDSLVSLTDISDQTYIIYIGYFSNVIQLRQSLYPSNFILEMSLSLANFPTTTFIHKDGSNVHLGYQNTYIRMAANTSIAAGLYTLQYSKTGDTNNKYTAVPPLTIVVSNKLCKLATKQTSYSLPRGGMTVPIVINGFGCIPINSITITPTFSNAEITMDTSLSSVVLRPSIQDGQLYVVAKHQYVALNVGGSVTLSFTISGSEAAYYDTIPSVTLSIIDPAPFQTIPTATSLSSPTLSYNRASFTFQCSIASKIYWGLGLYPSILNTQALDFEARIVSGATGLLTNFTEPEDFYMKVYGVNYVTTTQTLPKTVYNLKSNSQYIFKYYCVNQMGLISDGQSIIFNSLNYGAYLMKVSIIFNGSITYQQYSDLACSLALNFQIPYNRIMTEAMSVCGGQITPFYTATTDTIVKQANSNGQYVYNFYILPDYTIPIDPTNANIRSALTLSSTSTTIITSTNNVQNLPGLIQMQTEDIQFFASPSLTVSSPISGLNSLVVTAFITNMNGFIVMGCMNGKFDSASMTFPTATYIKKGLMSTNVTLLQVKMIYAIQNYNISFAFSGFSDNTEYTCFYFATTEDPTISAESTTVRSFNAQTLQALIVDINFQGSLYAIWALFIAISLILY